MISFLSNVIHNDVFIFDVKIVHPRFNKTSHRAGSLIAGKEAHKVKQQLFMKNYELIVRQVIPIMGDV